MEKEEGMGWKEWSKSHNFNIGRNASLERGVVVWDAPFAGMSPVSHVILILERLFLVYIFETGIIKSIKEWGRAGILKTHRYNDKGMVLFEDPGENVPVKWARQRGLTIWGSKLEFVIESTEEVQYAA